MKSKKILLGTALLAVGLAILVFSYFYFMTREDVTLSPVPYEPPPRSMQKK